MTLECQEQLSNGASLNSRQSVCAAEGGAREMTFGGGQKIMSESQTLNIDLFTLAEFGLILIWLWLCPDSSLLE